MGGKKSHLMLPGTDLMDLLCWLSQHFCHDCRTIKEAAATVELPWGLVWSTMESCLKQTALSARSTGALTSQVHNVAGLHDCSTITEAAKAIGTIVEATMTVVLSWRKLQMWCYHGDCHKYYTFMEVTTNVMLSQKMPQIWLYPKAAANATLTWRLCNMVPSPWLPELQHSHVRGRK